LKWKRELSQSGKHKRPRRRQPPGWSRPARVPVATLSNDPDAPLCDVKTITQAHPPKMKGVSVRSSLRWVDILRFPTTPYDIPHIDRLGRYTGFTRYRWSCDPRSAIATVVATIASRLRAYCRRHNDARFIRQNDHRILRAAALYALTKNSYMWDRVLFFARNLEKRGKLIHTCLLRFLSKLDENNQFVYSQVSYQTNWLLFRALRPRDKSKLNKGKGWISRITCDPISLANRCSYIWNSAKAVCQI